jgi:alpha-glucosidase (family GH31 glycosyl hydrolase)
MSFKKKENSDFYNTMCIKNFDNKYTVVKESIKINKFSTIISFDILKNETILKVQINLYQGGIIRIIIENHLQNGYKNKTEIGQQLHLEEGEIEVTNYLDKLIVEYTDSQFLNNLKEHRHSEIILNKCDEERVNIFTLVIHFENFTIEYYLNKYVIMSFNSEKELSCPFQLTHNKIDLKLFNTQSVFGLPERMSKFSLKDDTYRLFNLDVFDQIPGDPQSLYGSIPILQGLHSYSSDLIHSLFLMNNSSEIWVDIETLESESFQKNKLTKWTTSGGVLDFYFFSDYDFSINYYKLSLLTGFANLPAIFTLGYHQCRWGYLSQKDLEDIDQKMNFYEIPYDVIWLDIDVYLIYSAYKWKEILYLGQRKFSIDERLSFSLEISRTSFSHNN